MPANELLNIASPEYVRLTPAFYDALEAAVEVDSNAQLQEVVAAAMRVANLKTGENTVQWACIRIIREQEEARKKQSDQKPAPPGIGLGTSMVQWLSKLQLRQICYLLSNFDPLIAERLYYEADAAVLSEAFTLRSEYEMEGNRARYEASLYGFGGKYEKDKGHGGGDNMVDLTDGTANEAALRSLKALGF